MAVHDHRMRSDERLLAHHDPPGPARVRDDHDMDADLHVVLEVDRLEVLVSRYTSSPMNTLRPTFIPRRRCSMDRNVVDPGTARASREGGPGGGRGT